jgi:hypothetical protein
MQKTALAAGYEAQSLVQSRNAALERLGPPGSPFIIGVTGHRNLAEGDLARVRVAVSKFLGLMRQLLPDTQLHVMLGMVAGGDWVVAETALEAGMHVEAVLPMPRSEFMVDFDDRNRRLVEDLLAHRNLDCIELPLECGENAHLSRATEWREVLNRKSNVLLALWDGKAPRRPGGTSDTVLRCLRIRTHEHCEALRFAAADPAADTDSPFVYWIPITSGGHHTAVAETPPCFLMGLGDTILQFGSQPPEALRRRLREFNDYNRDFNRVAAEAHTAPSDSLLAKVPADLPGKDRPTLTRLDAEYGKADALALHYQKRSDGLFGIFGIFAFVLGCLYLIYDKLGENQGVLLAYLTILLGSLVLYRLLYTKVWFVKHLQYRALAETLRVNFYLYLAGIGRSVDAAEILTLSGIEHFEGFGCIRSVLRNVVPLTLAASPLSDSRLSEYIRTAWVEDQHRYFIRKVTQLERKSRRVTRWQSAAVIVTIVVLLMRLLFSQSLRSMYVIPGVPLKNLLTLIASVTALFLGAWKLHQSKMAARELIWQYKNQLAHFSRCSAELERTTTPDRRTEVLVELAKRSLMESYLWTIHRYHREHAPPAGA